MSNMTEKLDLEAVNAELESASATAILNWTFDRFPAEAVAFSTSFGAEGMVLMHMLVSLKLQPRIFTIDTGRNFQETYDVWNEAVKRLGVEIE